MPIIIAKHCHPQAHQFTEEEKKTTFFADLHGHFDIPNDNSHLVKYSMTQE
jgi:hypothetical protein